MSNCFRLFELSKVADWKVCCSGIDDVLLSEACITDSRSSLYSSEFCFFFLCCLEDATGIMLGVLSTLPWASTVS